MTRAPPTKHDFGDSPTRLLAKRLRSHNAHLLFDYLWFNYFHDKASVGCCHAYAGSSYDADSGCKSPTTPRPVGIGFEAITGVLKYRQGSTTVLSKGAGMLHLRELRVLH